MMEPADSYRLLRVCTRIQDGDVLRSVPEHSPQVVDRYCRNLGSLREIRPEDQYVFPFGGESVPSWAFDEILGDQKDATVYVIHSTHTTSEFVLLSWLLKYATFSYVDTEARMKFLRSQFVDSILRHGSAEIDLKGTESVLWR